MVRKRKYLVTEPERQDDPGSKHLPKFLVTLPTISKPRVDRESGEVPGPEDLRSREMKTLPGFGCLKK